MVRSSSLALVACIALASLSSIALADKPVAGSKGTCTAWEGKKVIAVEECTKGDNGDWDYISCSHALHDKVPGILCKRGPGKYNWGFQVGDDKPPLIESVTCK